MSRLQTTKSCDEVRPSYSRHLKFRRLLTGSEADAGGQGALVVDQEVLGRELSDSIPALEAPDAGTKFTRMEPRSHQPTY